MERGAREDFEIPDQACHILVMADAIPPEMGPKTEKASWKRVVGLLLKLFFTVGAFYLLLTHQIEDENGQSVRIIDVIKEGIETLSWSKVAYWVGLATIIKAVGIASSMRRWQRLLQGQNISFRFRHIAGSFLIGRFLGTFLPSTVGLDGYKLYDAAKFSENSTGALAATVVEKVLGLSGIFLTFLVMFPFGYQVLGEHAMLVAGITVPFALCLCAGVLLALLKPGWVEAIAEVLKLGRIPKVGALLEKILNAAQQYRGKGGLVMEAFGLSFIVHFTTAAMYWFTAIGVGAASADFGMVVFASSIQIFATVMSPFTIAGEGVREAVQALLLAKHIGASASILSAALGFWAAEALTMVGGLIWWLRPRDYRPEGHEVLTESSAEA